LRLAPLLLCLPLVLSSCSDDTESQGPAPLPTGTGLPAACASLAPDAPEVPAECVVEPSDGPPPIPTGSYPRTSAEIEAVTIPSAPTDLVRGGNDTDPTLATRTFSVTVPQGRRLELTAACNGATFLEVATVPESKAEVTMSCFEPGGISEITVSDDVFQTAPKQYQVTVTTKAPSRWYVALGSTAEPLPSDGPA
jgi:hypothetical protein